jgi:hypothetical protein
MEVSGHIHPLAPFPLGRIRWYPFNMREGGSTGLV